MANDNGGILTVSIVIPSYKRPNDLERCLLALTKQTAPAHEIIVVARPDDKDTWDIIKLFEGVLPIHGEEVKVPGVIEAENVGIKAASGTIIAFIDDDAAPHIDWIERIKVTFTLSEPDVIGVGGRDIIHIDGNPITEQKIIVGRVSWFGRLQGNHEYGFGDARYVDTLKGVNMAYRANVLKKIGIDSRLLGTGAQMHWELMLCAQVKRMGYRLLYDPSITVDHYPGKRFGRDQRAPTDPKTVFENVHNETLGILTQLQTTVQRVVFICWAFMVGHRGAPGLLQVVRLKLYRYPSLMMFLASQKARTIALRKYIDGKSHR